MKSGTRETVVGIPVEMPYVAVADGIANGDVVTGDPVLDALGAAADQYRAVRAALAHDAAEGRQAVAELAAARDAERRAAAELEQARAELSHVRADLEKERRRAERQRERADRMARAVKDIHRGLFGGNIYDLILRACLTLTGATRGLYLSAGADGRLRARSAVNLDGYPRKAPSAFVRALADKARSAEKTIVVNDPHEFAGLPTPDGAEEQFGDCLAAPVVLLSHASGVVILGDKPGGFDDDDVDLVMTVGGHAGIALQNERLLDEVLKAYFAVVGVLADAIEAKDPYTRGHCEQVARYARLTAERLTASPQVQSVCRYGGLLHDVGKIGVSDGVLNKPGKLLPEEWTLMQSHVRIGRDLLARVPALEGVADVVLYHHERYDGGGYPEGRRADQTPLAARIVCVADAYCAMVSKRSYKDSMTPAEAREELVRCRGTHFDPAVVDAFLAVLDDPASQLPDDPNESDLPPGLTAGADFRHALAGETGGPAR